MNRIHILFAVGYVAVSQQAACTEKGSAQRCSNEDVRHDLSVLLQHGASIDRLTIPEIVDLVPDNNDSTSVLEAGHTHLSQVDSAATLLSDILLGKIGKSEVELVLAHYNEDTTWSDAYASIRTIYCKGPQYKRPDGCHHLPNVGREGHTYLHHIVHNYDRLSKWTVFTQAQAPTQGYRGHRRGGGHALPGVPFDAYILPEDAGGLPREDGAAFVFTGALHMPTLNHSLRLSFVKAAKGPDLHQQTKCPRTELLDGWQKWWNLGWFKKFIGKRCDVLAKDVPEAFNEYWDSHVKLPRPSHNIIFFSQGARFAASRERIQQRPKEFYQALLHKLDHSLDPCHNYFNEWIWYYLIGKPETSPCDVDLVLDEANSDYQDEQMLYQEMVRYRKNRFSDNPQKDKSLKDFDEVTEKL